MTRMGGALTSAGYAKDTYAGTLIEREKEYPTATLDQSVGAVSHGKALAALWTRAAASSPITL